MQSWLTGKESLEDTFLFPVEDSQGLERSQGRVEGHCGPPTKVQAWDRAGKLIVGGWGGIKKYCPSDIVSPSAWRPFQRSLPYLYGTPSVPHLHTHTTTGMGTPYWQLHEPQPELKHQRFWLQTQGLPDRCDTLDRCLPTPKS